MSFRSPQSLLRTPLAAFRPPAATLGLPSSFQVRAASAAPSQAEQALSSALEDVKESSAIQALTEDVDAQKTLKEMSAFMESKGITPSKPPNVDKLSELLQDETFKKLQADMKAAMARLNLKPEELQKLGAKMKDITGKE